MVFRGGGFLYGKLEGLLKLFVKEPMPIVQSTMNAYKSVADWFHFWWLKVPEPRMVSVLFGMMYFTVILTGWVTLKYPPQSFQGPFSDVSIHLMAYFLIGGGVVGVIGGTSDFWKLERVGVVTMWLGLQVYLYIVVNLQIEASSGNRFTQIGTIVALGLSLLGRIAMIWRYDFKPRG